MVCESDQLKTVLELRLPSMTVEGDEAVSVEEAADDLMPQVVVDIV